MPTTPSPTPRLLVLVLVGGAAGAGLRQFAAGSGSAVPWEILSVNLIGAVMAGIVVGRVRNHSHAARTLMPLVVIGLAGAMTTFSGLVVDTLLLLDAGRLADAASYGGLSLIAGPGAAGVGLWAGGLT